jgi:hypothetical protein
MAWVKIGEAYTDNNGIATLPYTGTGRGVVRGMAKSTVDERIIQSETYSIWDTLFHDEVTNHNSSDWTIRSGITETVGEEHITLSSTQANSSTGLYILTQTFTGDIEATLQANITYNNAWAFYIGLRNGSNTSIAQVKVDGWKYLKFRRVNGVCTAYISSDNENWSEMTMYTDNVGSATCKFQLYIYTSATETARTADFKNLKVYSI